MEMFDIAEAARTLENIGYSEWLGRELDKAFKTARLGKRHTEDEHRYELHWLENSKSLRDSIVEHVFEPGSSLAFIIQDPMMREIFAAPFRDRIVHHYLYNISSGWWDRRFIYDSYSCRKGKGTLFGIKRTQKKMCQVTESFSRKAYVAKFDLKGYFMSLPRYQLLERVEWGLEQQFRGTEELRRIFAQSLNVRKIYWDCRFLWKQVLLDDPISKVKRRGPLSDWDDLPPEKSLFGQPEGQGIVIGNLTSQLVSNIYLDLLDRFVTHELGYKFYGRYVDDFYIMVTEEELPRLLGDVKVIERFLLEELGLILHPRKRYVQDVRKGMSYLGARIYPKCLYPSGRLQSNFWEAALAVAEGRRDVENIAAYLGLIKHLNGRKFAASIFEQLGWEYRF